MSRAGPGNSALHDESLASPFACRAGHVMTGNAPRTSMPHSLQGSGGKNSKVQCESRSRRDMSHAVSFTAGAVAGMTAEVMLFPLDSLKTRAMSRLGFRKAGGFKGVYRGLGVTMVGSVPGSAIFFVTYGVMKNSLCPTEAVQTHRADMLAVASICGELAACSVRVPTDLMKQRLQAGHAENVMGAANGLRTPHGGKVLMASFRVTMMRDIAQSGCQFPIFELLKAALADRSGVSIGALPTWQCAVCGSIAGAASAMVSTPLDLIKTRLNLRATAEAAGGGCDRGHTQSLVWTEMLDIYRSRGLTGFFSGAGLRATWMAFGGFIFLGSFEWAKNIMCELPHRAGDDAPSRVEGSRSRFLETQGSFEESCRVGFLSGA
eukprot:gnl/TRDRNA2_/TRDRNA2_61769_c0_seq1.p1 gnl/TRDRNA2_/TRDRNA2_61769_c0~~gnl/TRDRNA2_/TRDRNA2_61769_c0_seq1.p1  ORF type:complete len:377 (-),score=43.71 gnl/TRDRNA2_/TRDRNA2_61769_c0_seq1:190-1320(-)